MFSHVAVLILGSQRVRGGQRCHPVDELLDAKLSSKDDVLREEPSLVLDLVPLAGVDRHREDEGSFRVAELRLLAERPELGLVLDCQTEQPVPRLAVGADVKSDLVLPAGDPT